MYYPIEETKTIDMAMLWLLLKLPQHFNEMGNLTRKVILEGIKVLNLGLTGQSYVGKMVVMGALRNFS